MATDLDGLHEKLEEQFKDHEDEIEHIIPSCDTCAMEKLCPGAPYNGFVVEERCTDFVPTVLNGCVFINEEWWS